MNLRNYLLEQNIHNPDRIASIVEYYFRDILLKLDDQASILAEKHEGANDLVHYYYGKGMSLRDVAEESGFIVEWNPKHDINESERYRDYES